MTTRIDTMHAILHEEPKIPGRSKFELRQICRLLDKALAKKPRDRYQAVSELAADLKSVRRDLDLAPLSQVARTPASTRLVLKRTTMASRSGGIDYEKELNQSQFKAVMTTEGPLRSSPERVPERRARSLCRGTAGETSAKPESVYAHCHHGAHGAAGGMRAAAFGRSRVASECLAALHSLGHSVLRKFAERAGVQRNFTVLDQSDTEDLIDLLRRQIRISKDHRLPRKRTIAAIFSTMVNRVSP